MSLIAEARNRSAGNQAALRPLINSKQSSETPLTGKQTQVITNKIAQRFALPGVAKNSLIRFMSVQPSKKSEHDKTFGLFFLLCETTGSDPFEWANNGPVDDTGFAPRLNSDYKIESNRNWPGALMVSKSSFYEHMARTHKEVEEADCLLKPACAFQQLPKYRENNESLKIIQEMPPLADDKEVNGAINKGRNTLRRLWLSFEDSDTKDKRAEVLRFIRVDLLEKCKGMNAYNFTELIQTTVEDAILQRIVRDKQSLITSYYFEKGWAKPKTKRTKLSKIMLEWATMYENLFWTSELS